jgi:autotransporter-associated beta strand protein
VIGAGTRKRLLAGTALAAVLLLPSLAQAQTWTGGTDYNAAGNWNPANVPDAPGEAAIFADTGTTSVSVTSAIAPQSWTFAANAQNFVITGANVTFSAGLTNNAGAGQAISIANNMTGTTLSQAAASTLTLSGTNSFTTTSVSAGTLVNNGSLTSAVSNAGTFINNGTITGTLSNSAGTATIAGSVSDRVLITGGSVFLTGTGSLGGDVRFVGAGAELFDISGTNSGVSIRGLSSAGGSTGIVELGTKTLTFVSPAIINAGFSGTIQGSGGVTIGPGGFLRLNGVGNYTGATTVQGGSSNLILQSQNAIAASSVLNITAADATVIALASLNIQSLQGIAGSQLQTGGGTLTITNASTGFAGVINDFGNNSAVTLTAGHQTLDGTNAYTGATTVNGGTLTVNGSIAASSMTTVNVGATLDGSGIVGNTTINGGTLSPGTGGIGTMTVQGSLTLTAASTYLVEVSPTTADRTNVIGAAILGGAAVRTSYAAGSYVARQYTILNATSGVGGSTFGALLSDNLPASLRQSLSYDIDNAYLNTELLFAVPGGLTGNQAAVGNALTNSFNVNGGIPFVYTTLSPTALSQAAGETATGSQQSTFTAMNQFMGVMTDPFIAGRSDDTGAGGNATNYADEAMAYATRRHPNDALAAIDSKTQPRGARFEARWSTWVAGFGGSQTTDGNPTVGASTATSRVYGTAVGADYRFSPFTIAGFALAGGGTNFSVANNGTGRSDLFQAGAFIRHDRGAAYISGALAYGWQDVTTDRTVTIAGVDQLRARFNANAWSGRVESGYRFVAPAFGGLGVAPYAAGQFTTFDLPAYAESVLSGAGTFALAYGSQSVTDTRSELGFRTDTSFAMPGAILTLRGRAAWAHDYNPTRAIGATFQALPGASFVVNGAAQASDAALTTASAEIRWNNRWSAAATFEGEFSDVTRSYAGKGVVRYAW